MAAEKRTRVGRAGFGYPEPEESEQAGQGLVYRPSPWATKALSSMRSRPRVADSRSIRGRRKVLGRGGRDEAVDNRLFRDEWGDRPWL
jgi:hypothetical protein